MWRSLKNEKCRSSKAGWSWKWKCCQTEWKIHWSKKHSRMPGWWRRLFAAKFSASKFAEAAAFSFSISISEIRQRSCSSSTLLKSLFTCKSRRTVNGALVATRKIQVTATIKSTLYQQSKVQQWEKLSVLKIWTVWVLKTFYKTSILSKATHSSILKILVKFLPPSSIQKSLNPPMDVLIKSPSVPICKHVLCATQFTDKKWCCQHSAKMAFCETVDHLSIANIWYDDHHQCWSSSHFDQIWWECKSYYVDILWKEQRCNSDEKFDENLMKMNYFWFVWHYTTDIGFSWCNSFSSK